jgi:hypothetical protein
MSIVNDEPNPVKSGSRNSVDDPERGPDLAEVQRALSVLADYMGSCALIRLPPVPGGFCVRSGNQVKELAEHVGRWTDAAGVYYYVNPVADTATQKLTNEDVLSRRWILVDIDRRKTADNEKLSATEAEHEAARALTTDVVAWLQEEHDFPAPVIIDSGNGFHLLYRVDLANDQHSAALARAFLQALARKFNGDRGTIGKECHDAKRIAKLPGTWSRRGPDTPDRPHRMARLVDVPAEVQEVAVELLQAFAEPERPKPPPRGIFKLRASDAQYAGYARAALRGECGILRLCPEGQRHNQAYKSAARLGNMVGAGVISRQEVEADLFAAATQSGLPEGEARQVISDGLDKGISEPLKLPQRNGQHQHQAGPAPASGDDAPGLAPRQVPPYKPFPVSALPPIVREYTEASAAAIGCDPALVAVPALPVLAGCIGNSCVVRLKHGWIEPSVIWAATLAPSGKLKTPAWAAAQDPLVEYQCELAGKDQRNREWYEQAIQEWRDRPRSERGPRPQLPQAEPCYVTSDATIEAVGRLLADNPHGLLLSRDELDGWLQSFVRYKGNAGGTDRPHWLELHRAGTLRKDRVTGDRPALTVRRACCSLTGTIQDDIFARALNDEAMAAGLCARILLAMPPPRKRVWTEAQVEENLAERYGNLLKALLAILLADVEKRKAHVFKLSDHAKQRWVEWVPTWGDKTDTSEGEQAAALAKLEGYAARLALVHHVVTLTVEDPSRLVVEDISENSMCAALTLVEWFAGEAARVYTILRETDAERVCRRLVEWIQARGGSTSARELHRANPRRWPSSEHAELALEVLVQSSLGEWRETHYGSTGGRPTRRFFLLPQDAR